MSRQGSQEIQKHIFYTYNLNGLGKNLCDLAALLVHRTSQSIFFALMKLGRKIYNEVVGDTQKLRAVATLLFFKSKYKNSVITDFTYSKLSAMSGISRTSVKRYIAVLSTMGMVSRIGYHGQHILFHRVRAKYNNIDITKLDFTSIKTIELGLKAIFIVEVQNRKDYIKHKLSEANPSEHAKTSPARIKRAKKAVCGIEKFSDNGISYKYIASQLGIGFAKVSEMLKYGVSIGLFAVKNNIKQVYYGKDAKIIFKYLDLKNVFLFKNSIYKVACNTYSLV